METSLTFTARKKHSMVVYEGEIEFDKVYSYELEAKVSLDGQLAEASLYVRNVWEKGSDPEEDSVGDAVFKIEEAIKRAFIKARVKEATQAAQP